MDMPYFLKPLPPALEGFLRLGGKFCTQCLKIFTGGERLRIGDGLEPNFILHENLTSFKDAKEEGCKLCNKIWHRLKPHTTKGIEELPSDTSFVTYRAGHLDAGLDAAAGIMFNLFTAWKDTTPDGYTLVTMVEDLANPGQQRSPETIKHNGSTYIAESSVALALSPSKLHDERKIEDMGDSSGSPHSRKIASHWFKTCTETHQHKENNIDPPFFPDRVLEVSDDETRTFKLLCKDMGSLPTTPELYATLSYCWGTANHLKLETGNMKKLAEGIALTQLPKTFADAASLVLTLGLKYLWVDSLCIIQDSKQDWKQQSGMMGSIYQKSNITIAGTASTDSNGGLFKDRNPRTILSAQLQTRLGTADSPITWYDIVDQQPYVLDIYTAPLNQRGWVLQERMLPTRILHCTKDQLYWECEHLLANESYPQGLRVNLNDETDKCKRILLRRGSSATPAQAEQQHEARMEWLRLINNYTRCKLTKEDDILVAISGLAKSWEAMFPDKYRAGLWEKMLPHALLWQGMRRVMDMPNTPRYPLRGPSWSWPSFKGGEVRWSEAVSPRKHSDGTSYSVEAVLAHMLEYETQLASDDPTGPVSKGAVVMQGALLRGAAIGSYQLPYEIIASHPGWRSIMMRTSKHVWRGVCGLDHRDIMTAFDKDPNYPHFCVPFLMFKVIAPNGAMNVGVEGLILNKRPEGTAGHERLGYFQIALESHDSSEAERLLSLVKEDNVIKRLQALEFLSDYGYGFYLFMIE